MRRLVDYAGLFPPAALSMEEAVRRVRDAPLVARRVDARTLRDSGRSTGRVRRGRGSAHRRRRRCVATECADRRGCGPRGPEDPRVQRGASWPLRDRRGRMSRRGPGLGRALRSASSPASFASSSSCRCSTIRAACCRRSARRAPGRRCAPVAPPPTPFPPRARSAGSSPARRSCSCRSRRPPACTIPCAATTHSPTTTARRGRACSAFSTSSSPPPSRRAGHRSACSPRSSTTARSQRSASAMTSWPGVAER